MMDIVEKAIGLANSLGGDDEDTIMGLVARIRDLEADIPLKWKAVQDQHIARIEDLGRRFLWHRPRRPTEGSRVMTCQHDLSEREVAAYERCPICLAAEIVKLREALKDMTTDERYSYSPGWFISVARAALQKDEGE